MAFRHILAVFTLMTFSLQINVLIPYLRTPKVAHGKCIDKALEQIAESPIAGRITVVFNSSNDPISTDQGLDNPYKICFSYLKNKQVKVLGLVKTRVGGPIYTGYRTIGEVHIEIDIWYNSFPNLDGVYFADVSNAWLQPYDESREKVVEKYNGYIAYAHSNNRENKQIVLNSESAIFFELLENKGDLVAATIFNDNHDYWAPQDGCISLLWSTSNGSFGNGPWCQYVPKFDEVELLKDKIGKSINSKQVSVLIESVPSEAVISERIKECIDNKIGSIYMSDKHNWNEFSSEAFWHSFVSAISAIA
jgi:hypothetical protein